MSSIDYRVTEGRCVLRLNNPPVNTITLALLEEVRSALRQANADASVRSIVVTGSRGLKNVLNELEILTNQLGNRFAPCKLLNELKDTQ